MKQARLERSRLLTAWRGRLDTGSERQPRCNSRYPLEDGALVTAIRDTIRRVVGES